MLIELTLIPRRGAKFNPPVRTVGLNPELIHSAQKDFVPGYDGPATRLEIEDHQILFVTESVREVIQRAAEACGPVLVVSDPNGLETA